MYRNPWVKSNMRLRKNFIFHFSWLRSVSRKNPTELTTLWTFFFHHISSTPDYAILVLMLRLWTKVANGTSKQLDTMHLVKAMTLAKIAKFCMIPIVIWSRNETDSASLRLILVHSYYLLSLMHVLSVLTGCSRKTSVVMTILTVIIKHIVMVELAQRLRALVMIWFNFKN